MTIIKITKDGDEITRHGFISHLEHYFKQLLADPIHASIGDYLMSHGLNNEELLPLLLKAKDKSDENSAILVRKERIKTDKDTGKDKFYVKYSIPHKDYDKKMRHLFADLFENYQTDNELLNEEGEGATSADASGPLVQPFGEPIKRDIYKLKNENDIPEMKKNTVILREEQIEALKEILREDGVESTGMGGGFEFGYDAPASVCDKNDPTMKRHNGKGGSISVNTME